jgi:hypothetical protein
VNDTARRVSRAVQTARECATCAPGLADVKLARFHRAMDALAPGEGEQVYDLLRDEGWYRLAADALARTKSAAAGDGQP